MDTLKIIPLGGLGEFGLNMMLLEYGDAAIAIDCGLMFPSADLLGIDLVIPDVSYLIERRDKLKAIVLTHAHEDHVGALPYILEHFDVPIFGTRLTLGLLANRLREHDLEETVDERFASGEGTDRGRAGRDRGLERRHRVARDAQRVDATDIEPVLGDRGAAADVVWMDR